ncbi:MAG: hypothetical protein R3A44_38830 [Caldilineaceae bacterium]
MHQQRALFNIASYLRKAWRFNRLLTTAVALHFLLIPIVLTAIFLDPKTITGVNGWIKPLKFAISGGIYGLTFAWFLIYVRGRQRWVQIAANITGLALLVETTLITMQVVRGVASHFNVSTAFDGAVFSIMGFFILLLALMNLLTAIFLLLQRLPDRVLAWSLRLGLLISLAGMVTGFLMTAGPTPAQMAALAAGETVNAIGAHSVGVADGGPGLPLLGWSTTGGDLRVAHFFGLHGLQALPLLGWLLTRRRTQQVLTEGQRYALVWTGGLSYLGLVILLTWQALRGQPVLALDAATAWAYALLIGYTLLALFAILAGNIGIPAKEKFGAALTKW